jgi:hypothetical protein
VPRPWRDLVAAGLALGLALLPSAALADQPGTGDPDPSAQGASGPRAVDDAVLRWGLNDESNNRAFAPGTINFLSAGKVPDPGRGGTIMPASGWSARTGDVAVEKWDGSAYRPATWAGLRTDATGAAIGGGRFSGHQLVFSGGEGTIDAAAGDATISWDGDASVVYYSGMAFFYLSDPELVVEDGVGQVTAELGRSASSSPTWAASTSGRRRRRRAGSPPPRPTTASRSRACPRCARTARSRSRSSTSSARPAPRPTGTAAAARPTPTRRRRR